MIRVNSQHQLVVFKIFHKHFEKFGFGKEFKNETIRKIDECDEINEGDYIVLRELDKFDKRPSGRLIIGKIHKIEWIEGNKLDMETHKELSECFAVDPLEKLAKIKVDVWYLG